MDPNLLDALMAKMDQTLIALFEIINQRMDQMKRALNDHINALSQSSQGAERNLGDPKDSSIGSSDSEHEGSVARSAAQSFAQVKG